MDIPPFVEKNWPYILGGVVGIGAILYMRSASAAPSYSGGVDTTALIAQSYQAQQGANSNALAQAQLQAGINAQAQANALEVAKLNAQIDANSQALQQRQNESDQTYALGMATLNNAQYANNNAAQVAYAGATGEIAGQLGAAANGVINALNTPAIVAMNAAAQENAATMSAASLQAAAGYAASSGAIQSAMQIPALASLGMGTQGQTATPSAGSSQTETQAIATAGAIALAFMSDENSKENIAPVERDSVADILALEIVSYDYKAGGGHSVGIIAQQAQSINPEWVGKVEGSEYLHVDVAALLLSAVHAIKTLSARVIELENAA